MSSTATPIASRSEKILGRILDHMTHSGELVQGADADIRRHYPDLARGGPGQVVGDLMAVLAGPHGLRWLNPEFKAEGSPLRRILHRLPIDGESVASLNRAWALDGGNAFAAAGFESMGFDPADALQREADGIGRFVGERLFGEVRPDTDRSVHRHLPADLRPDPPIAETRVKSVLLDLARHFRPGTDFSALAREWTIELGMRPEPEIARAVVVRLNTRPELRRGDEEVKLPWDHPALQERRTEADDRAVEELRASGRYSGF